MQAELPESAGDARSLAAGLLELLADSETRKRMGEQGRVHAQDFSWDRVGQQVLSYYERLLHERALVGAERESERGVS